MNNIQIFISYSEDSPYHIKKIERIVNYLEKEGYVVYFYAKAPLGTNNMEFMQKIGELLSLKINFYGASFSIFDFAIWYLFATLVIWIVKQLLF